MSLPRYEISLLMLLLALMVIGLLSYQTYIWRIENIVRRTSGRPFQKKDLKRAIKIPQGSNFNTMMLISWNLFLIALAFLYFLTPEIFPAWNFFRFPQVASESFGLAIMGVMILIPGFVVSLHVPQVYGYYLISKWLKELILLTPLLLIVSILCSVHLGIVYPRIDSMIWNTGYVTLFVSLVLLILPIVLGFGEEMR
ncbi:MAG: hypothetical protein ABR985_03475 [Methanotrichaceae archaeon]